MRYDGARSRHRRGRLERGRPAAVPGRRRARPRRRHGRRPRRAHREAARVDLRGGERHAAGDGRGAGYRSAVAAPVNVGGGCGACWPPRARRRIRCPEGIEQRLCDFADLVAQALANADAYEKLAASRARLVEVGDAERRRLERNLHDGAQQRLVSVALGLNMASGSWRATRPWRASCWRGAQAELARGLDELRELARGIHPAVLTERGLGPALEALAARAPVPWSYGGPRGAPARAGRGGRLLRRRRVDHERGQVRARGRRHGEHRARQRDGHGDGQPTTASAAPIPRAARACAASPPASRRSMATFDDPRSGCCAWC